MVNTNIIYRVEKAAESNGINLFSQRFFWTEI